MDGTEQVLGEVVATRGTKGDGYGKIGPAVGVLTLTQKHASSNVHYNQANVGMCTNAMVP